MKTLALVALVAQFDLSYTVASRTAQPVTGERVTYDVRVANAGPDASPNVVVTIGRSLIGSVLVDLVAPAGWQCGFERYSDAAVCTSASLAAGGSATFTATALMPNQPTPLYLGGYVTSGGGELTGENNRAFVLLAPTPAPRKADLQIVADAEVVVREGGGVRHQLTVTNHGPDEARDVAAVLRLLPPAATSIAASGAGWTCTTTAPQRAYCTRPSLAAGASASIDVQFRAPASEDALLLFAMPIAELNHDPTTGFQNTAIFVGSRESWRMLLVPLVNDDIPGANGSLWRTSLTMLVRSDVTIDVQPERCTFSGLPECTNFDAPPRTPFDPRVNGFIHTGAEVNGQFVYVRAADAEKVSMNARTWDQSRYEQTAGAGIAIPTESKFGDVNVLLNIPVAPEYRHTLRIYDADGRDGARVAIRLYANDEQQPRVTLDRTLAAPDDRPQITTARLPVHPAFAQLQLDQVMELGGVESVRAEVEPLDDGVAIWSFVSITNNATHHVTTVTPQ
jgi:hypothetical protein